MFLAMFLFFGYFILDVLIKEVLIKRKGCSWEYECIPVLIVWTHRAGHSMIKFCFGTQCKFCFGTQCEVLVLFSYFLDVGKNVLCRWLIVATVFSLGGSRPHVMVFLDAFSHL